jgi:hypothetical protein
MMTRITHDAHGLTHTRGIIDPWVTLTKWSITCGRNHSAHKVDGNQARGGWSCANQIYPGQRRRPSSSSGSWIQSPGGTCAENINISFSPTCPASECALTRLRSFNSFILLITKSCSVSCSLICFSSGCCLYHGDVYYNNTILLFNVMKLKE